MKIRFILITRSFKDKNNGGKTKEKRGETKAHNTTLLQLLPCLLPSFSSPHTYHHHLFVKT